MLDRREISKCPPVYSTQYAMQCMLNKVHPTVFPLIEKWRNVRIKNKANFVKQRGVRFPEIQSDQGRNYDISRAGVLW